MHPTLGFLWVRSPVFPGPRCSEAACRNSWRQKDKGTFNLAKTNASVFCVASLGTNMHSRHSTSSRRVVLSGEPMHRWRVGEDFHERWESDEPSMLVRLLLLVSLSAPSRLWKCSKWSIGARSGTVSLAPGRCEIECLGHKRCMFRPNHRHPMTSSRSLSIICSL